MKKSALIVIDYINEIVDKDGKLSGKGYLDFIEAHKTLSKVNEAIDVFHAADMPVIFVRIAFDFSYANQPKESPLFGKAHEFGILKNDSWSTEISPVLNYISKDIVVVKSRVSAFHNTDLNVVLGDLKVSELFLSGVATDLAVEATARAAHDYDYLVTVIADACVAASQAEHDSSLSIMSKIASVINVEEISF